MSLRGALSAMSDGKDCAVARENVCGRILGRECSAGGRFWGRGVEQVQEVEEGRTGRTGRVGWMDEWALEIN